MKIALVHDHLTNLGGAEVVLRELVQIFPQAPLYTFTYNPAILASIFGAQIPKIITSPFQDISLARHSPRWFLPAIPGAFESFSFKDFDVVFSSTSGLAKGIVTHPKCTHVTYCHTPTRYLWSDAGSYLEELRVPRLARRIIASYLSGLRTWDWSAAQRIDEFIANSKFVSARIARYYGRPSKVIHPPIDTNKFYTVSPDQVGNYFLLISRLRPYKRIDLVIEAFNHTGIPLIVVGVGSEGKRLIRRARSNITFRGFVTESEKYDLLAHARALIHPQEEDFGLTPLESHASGRPTIAYHSGGACETVLEGQNGTFFYEQSWEALAHTIVHFDERQFDPLKVRASCQPFSRELFRKNIIETVAAATPRIVMPIPAHIPTSFLH